MKNMFNSKLRNIILIFLSSTPQIEYKELQSKKEKKKEVCVHSKPYDAKPKEIILQKNTYIHKWLYFKITVVCRQTLNKSKSLVDYVHWNDKITQNGKVKSVFPTWSYNFLHPKFSISGKKIITSVAFFFFTC